MISILYDPGNFPGILKNKEDSDYYIRNGGVPQEGSLEEHMKVLKEQIDQLIPDKHFNGKYLIPSSYKRK